MALIAFVKSIALDGFDLNTVRKLSSKEKKIWLDYLIDHQLLNIQPLTFLCRFQQTITPGDSVWQVRDLHLVLVALPARVRQTAEVVPLRVLPEVHEVVDSPQAPPDQVPDEASAWN